MGGSILITGGNGFIGHHLISLLQNSEIDFVLALRNIENNKANTPQMNIRKFDLSFDENDYTKLFENIDVVVHLAGIAHKKSISTARYNQINVEGTQKLAQQACRNGVKRFIFLSTVKVHGEFTSDNIKLAINEKSPLNPQDDYSKSKLITEQLLVQSCSENNMEYVILRVPLVYGPGVKANFYSLLNLISHNIPLPLSHVKNLRSFLYVKNLCLLIEKIIRSSNCRNKIYLVKDCNLSTTDLVTKLSTSMSLSPRLFHISPKYLEPCARILNMKTKFDRVFESLVVDDAKIRHELSWQPHIELDTCLKLTVEWFKDLHS
ncbi:MAG: NAD-dependent epimerase/dehydratase family protein [Gammaproteobacteria bacterium]|jgi:nucleoside-diphosphate-sugar epimerase